MLPLPSPNAVSIPGCKLGDTGNMKGIYDIVYTKHILIFKKDNTI
jgi:hypothetical protein